MDLSTLKAPKGANRNRKRKGRGQGSTLGKTAGKGHKGQKARSGGQVKAGFEGGQMPLQRRLPKQGFTNIHAKLYGVVNVSTLERAFEEGEEVSFETVAAKRLIKKHADGLKVLGQGTLSKKLVVKAAKVSASAQEKISAAGGTVEVIGG
jgi:large subunit ribosomal protein L15